MLSQGSRGWATPSRLSFGGDWRPSCAMAARLEDEDPESLLESPRTFQGSMRRRDHEVVVLAFDGPIADMTRPADLPDPTLKDFGSPPGTQSHRYVL